MILKKPYAFLIKYFKIIHIILAVLIGFIINNFSNVTKFFSLYIKSNITKTIIETSKYINPIVYLALLIVIIFSLAMFILMKNKKKPTVFYITLFIYYFIIFIAIFIANNVIASLSEVSLTHQSARIYRDIYLIISIPQYYFIILSSIRGIGFDIKKFNFNKDLEELEIKSDDNEEFEFIVGKDSYIYKRKIRRFIREAKYYILENKLIIIIIGSVIFIPLIIYFIINFNFINKIYKVGSTGTIGDFTYNLKAAYETQFDYNGNIINKNKKYIILNMKITNNSSSPKKFEDASFFLKSGNNFYYNKPSLRNYFIDIGKAYTKEDIPGNATRNLIFIFEINNKSNFKKYYLNLLKEVTYKDNQDIYNYAKFKIKPIKIDEKPKVDYKQKNEILRLGDKIFNDSNLIITDIVIDSSYEYLYEICKENKCKEYIDVIKPQDSANQNLLIITYKLNMSKDIGFTESMKNNKDFFDKFLRVEYNFNNKNIKKAFLSRLYKNIENKVFIDLPKLISDSKDINIMINTRSYRHYIKYNK